MAKEIKDITLKKASELLQDNYVLSVKNIRYDHKSNTLIQDVNVTQVLLVDNLIHLLVFGSFGIKLKEKCTTIEQEDILCHLETINDQIVTCHKQRIPKKKNNSSIIDEADSKLLVYDWLLKKYPKESDVIVPEISFGERRVDYVAFGDKETCMVEIKSEVDIVERLQQQIDKYKIFANYVYIAIHSSKIKKLEDLDIPSFVGILEISNKLKLVKRATKQKIEPCIFSGHLSYNEYKSMGLGLKHSSKFEKKDLEDIFEVYFTTKQKDSYSFNSLKGRHKTESNIRRKLHSENDRKKAVGNTKDIGINRMSCSSNATMTLRNHFEVDNEYLISIMNGLQKKFNKLYKDYTHSELILDDRMLFRAVLKMSGLSIQYISSSYMRLKLMIEYSDFIIANREKIIQYINDEFTAKVKEVKETSDYYHTTSYSLLTCKYLASTLQDMSVASIFSKAIVNGKKCEVNVERFFGDERILIIHKSNYFHIGRVDSIKEIELWEL